MVSSFKSDSTLRFSGKLVIPRRALARVTGGLVLELTGDLMTLDRRLRLRGAIGLTGCQQSLCIEFQKRIYPT